MTTYEKAEEILRLVALQQKVIELYRLYTVFLEYKLKNRREEDAKR